MKLLTSTISKTNVKQLLGQTIYAVRKDGSVVTGKLSRIKGQQLYLQPEKGKVQTKAVVPLVLFDLLAIGTIPYAYGSGGLGGYGGIGSYGSYGSYVGYGGYPPIASPYGKFPGLF